MTIHGQQWWMPFHVSQRKETSRAKINIIDPKWPSHIITKPLIEDRSLYYIVTYLDPRFHGVFTEKVPLTVNESGRALNQYPVAGAETWSGVTLVISSRHADLGQSSQTDKKPLRARNSHCAGQSATRQLLRSSMSTAWSVGRSSTTNDCAARRTTAAGGGEGEGVWDTRQPAA